MRVIVTGGTGLIGSKLAAELAAENHDVIVLSRNPGKHTLPPGVRAEKWDAKTAAGWGHLADGADAIVNLAGEPLAGRGLFPSRWTAERKRRILESRLNAGRAVTEAVRAATTQPNVVIQSSGADYYGNRGDEIVTEETPAGKDSFLSHVTIDWEASTAPVEEMGVRRVIIRSAMVLSLESGALPITVLPFRFFVGGPLGNGEQWWPWIHLDDEVRAIRFLMDNGSASGPFNLSSPNPLKNKDFAKAIGRVLNRPSLIPVPAFAMRLALGEVADIVLEGRRAVPQRLQEMGFTFRYPQAEAALRASLK